MAREGKKLELYEILAAKQAKGKTPLGIGNNNVRQANSIEPEPDGNKQVAPEGAGPGIIIDDAVSAEISLPRPAPESGERQTYATAWEARTNRSPERQVQSAVSQTPELAPEPEPRPKSPREVVFSLDIAFALFFLPILGLVISSYFLGYKRGQEERPVGLAGFVDIETADSGLIKLQHLAPAPRSTMRLSDQDYTLILRTEPAGDDLPERLEMELAEAVAMGQKKGGGDIQGFIFRTGGNSPLHVLAVGLGRRADDPDLTRLQQLFYQMDGITLSRTPLPYRECRIAAVRDLGTSVY